MLGSQHRFHGYNALNFAYKQGSAVRGSALTLRYVINKRRQTFRVAVVVSRKVSKSAVVRNRIRRRVYEAVRLHTNAISEPYDLIFMVYSIELATMQSAQLQKNIADQLRRAGIMV